MSLGAPLLFALLAALLSGFVAGLTGFGFSLLCAPLLLFSYGQETVVVLTAVLAAFVSADVVRDSWREADGRLAAALLGPALLGAAAGAWALRAADSRYLEFAVGAAVASRRCCCSGTSVSSARGRGGPRPWRARRAGCSPPRRP